MRLGIDLDNTICDTLAVTLYLQKVYSLNNEVEESSIWENENLKKDFLQTNLRKIYKNTKLKRGVKESFNILRSNGIEILVVTSRNQDYVKDVQGITYSFVESNHLPVKEILFNSGNKVDICLKNKIDLMIEDRYDKFLNLRNANINTLLFDDKGQYPEETSKISEWNEVSVSKILKLLRNK